MTLRQHLDALIARGEIRADPAQAAGIAALDALLADCIADEAAHDPKSAGFLTRLLGGTKRRSKKGYLPEDARRGAYLYGSVGRGKTMLMDQFLACLPAQVRVMRTHFHRFMLGLHNYSHEWRAAGGKARQMDQVLLAYAGELAAEYDLIAFDEFHVVDVADAMLLGRLVKALLDLGVRFVMTSNWAPEDLYKGGLQRDRFLPAIALIRAHFHVAELNGVTDYRRQRVSVSDLYLSPLGAATDNKADALFASLTDGAEAHAVSVSVKGRQILIPKAAKGVAQASFADLCMKPLAAQDYLALTRQFHTLFLRDVPQLTPAQRNEAKRLMILVDVFYEQNRLMVITAAALPDALYSGGDHAFEFTRTASRLMEMQSEAYLAKVTTGE